MSPRPVLLVVLLLLFPLPGLSADARVAPGAGEPWWEHPGDLPGVEARPAEGGWILRWTAAPGAPLSLRWPRDPAGFPGRYAAFVDASRAGLTVREVGPRGWDLATDREILLTRERDTVAAMAALLAAPQGSTLRWSRSAPEDPLVEVFPGLLVEVGEAGTVELWVADGAPAESLRVRRGRLTGGERRTRDFPSAWLLPPGIAPAELRRDAASRPALFEALGLTAVLLGSEDQAPGRSRRLAEALDGTGLDPVLEADPFRLTLDQVRRLPPDARGAGIEGSEPRAYLPSGSRAGRRAVLSLARRGLAASARGFSIRTSPGSAGADPEALAEVFEAFRAGAGNRPVRVVADRFPLPVPGGTAFALESSSAATGGLDPLLTLAWRAVSGGGGGSGDPGPVSLGHPDEGEARLSWMRSLLAGGPLLLDAGSWALPSERLPWIAAALPPTGRTAQCVDLLRGGVDVARGPWTFVLEAPGREVRAFLNPGDQPVRVTGRAGLRGSPGSGGDVLVHDARFGAMVGRFPRLAPLPVSVGARDARWFSIVEDPGRPTLVATRAHWTEGLLELLREEWDAARSELTLELDRAPGAAGVLVVACATPPSHYRLEGFRALGPASHRVEEGVGVWRLPVEWESGVGTLILGYGAATPRERGAGN